MFPPSHSAITELLQALSGGVIPLTSQRSRMIVPNWPRMLRASSIAPTLIGDGLSEDRPITPVERRS